MEPFYGEWIVLVLNGIIIALVLTAPVLVGVLVIRALRKGVSRDRQEFEHEIREKLEAIVESQELIRKQLDDSSSR